jgi:hypothetical protein
MKSKFSMALAAVNDCQRIHDLPHIVHEYVELIVSHDIPPSSAASATAIRALRLGWPRRPATG